MADWPILESVTEYDTTWYTGGYDLVEQPDGSTKKYYWAELPPAVIIVPHHTAPDPAEIVFITQYRPAIRKPLLELPAGIVEPEESYAAAAARELEEETGYTPGTVTVLQEYWVATGILRHRRAIAYATDLTPGPPERDSNEFVTTTPRPVSEALAAARSHPANDATIDGLLLAQADGYLASS